MRQTTVQSRHFTLYQAADGVYAAIATADGGGGSNAGIVDLGGCTLVFDGHLTLPAARDLCAAAERLFGNQALCLVNSHWHGDHTHGNQVFPAAAQILATQRTRELMATRLPALVEHHRAHGPAHLARLEEQLRAAATAESRAELSRRLAVDRLYVETLADLTIRLPTICFDDRVVLHGTRRRAEVITFGGGHTESDAVLFLPEDALLFAGDLCPVETHPWLGDGDPEEWLRSLDWLEALRPRTVVPGHGQIGGPADLELTRRYLDQVQQHAAQAARRGLPADQAGQEPVPAALAHWQMPHMYGRNLQFLVQRAARA